MNMENLTPDDEHYFMSWQKSQRRGKVVAGILVIAFGIIYLINETGTPMPKWIFTLPMFILALGFVVLIKHKFKMMGGWILMAIGGVLMANEFYPESINSNLIWPIVIILIGLKLVFKSKNNYKEKHKKWQKFKQHRKCSNPSDYLNEVSDTDFVDTVSLFGGVSKNIVTKNFKGADIVTVFGGAEINMLQADFENEAIMEVTCVFGGVSLIIPANWQLKTDSLVTAFGSIEDKRQLSSSSENAEKTLVVRGNCIFGGIEIKSFK